MRFPRGTSRTMRPLAAPCAIFAVTALLLASCASKVGDRGPTRVTTVPLTDLLSTSDALPRLCLDVKTILGTDVRTRATCALASRYFEPAHCRASIELCVRDAPVDESNDFGDCSDFIRNARHCGDLLVGAFVDCALARGKRLLALA